MSWSTLSTPSAAAGLKPESCPAAPPETDKQVVCIYLFIYYYVAIIFLYCTQVPGERGTPAKRRKEKIIGYLWNTAFDNNNNRLD